MDTAGLAVLAAPQAQTQGGRLSGQARLQGPLGMGYSLESNVFREPWNSHLHFLEGGLGLGFWAKGLLALGQ